MQLWGWGMVLTPCRLLQMHGYYGEGEFKEEDAFPFGKPTPDVVLAGLGWGSGSGLGLHVRPLRLWALRFNLSTPTLSIAPPGR